MDKGGQRENGHKQDQYKQLLSHHQWIAHSQSMKDPTTLKLISVIAERDAAIQQRDAALNEKKAALAERDMAMLHRDAAYAERNAALMERDAAMAALHRENGMSWSPGAQRANPRTAGKNMYSDDSYNRSTQTSEAQPMPVLGPVLDLKPRRSKPPQKEKIAMASSRKPRKSRRPASGEDLNQQVSANHEWKDQDLGLNQVAFDDTMMPIPVCSCTGVFQQCYKWGNGGWQSACCTNTISMYPLPALPNKKHARMSGRKMSGGAFNKLLNKLAAEGHDLSLPVDLKDRWAKHGTNRYITIK